MCMVLCSVHNGACTCTEAGCSIAELQTMSEKEKEELLVYFIAFLLQIRDSDFTD